MLSLLVLLLAPMTACHKKTPGEKIQDGLEEVGDGISDAADNVKDKAEDVKDDIKDGLDGH
ncbi:MAG: YtxH domain-containing protein [Acidobacteria bacterium]|nr:YtxH domain-containing protein [Acidobacteriota bacterium]